MKEVATEHRHGRPFLGVHQAAFDNVTEIREMQVRRWRRNMYGEICEIKGTPAKCVHNKLVTGQTVFF